MSTELLRVRVTAKEKEQIMKRIEDEGYKNEADLLRSLLGLTRVQRDLEQMEQVLRHPGQTRADEIAKADIRRRQRR